MGVWVGGDWFTLGLKMMSTLKGYFLFLLSFFKPTQTYQNRAKNEGTRDREGKGWKIDQAIGSIEWTLKNQILIESGGYKRKRIPGWKTMLLLIGETEMIRTESRVQIESKGKTKSVFEGYLRFDIMKNWNLDDL